MPPKRGSKRATEKERKITSADVKGMLGPLGRSGTLFYTGDYNINDELEYVDELSSTKRIDTYNRMRRSDGQVKLALLALQNPIVNADWILHPPGDPSQDDMPTPKELEQTKRLNEWIFGEEFEFTETLRQILSMFWAGFSLFEKLYAIEPDGTLVVRKLAPRMQNTIMEWFVSEDGRLEKVRQEVYGGQTSHSAEIPGKKLVCFTFQKEGDDFRGISALRAAYKHWYIKDFLYRVDSMRNERWGLGVPVIIEEGAITSAQRKKAFIEAVENMRLNEKGFLYVPKGYRVEMLDAGAAKMIDPIPSMQHHDAQILKTIMAQFLELGMTETGARSLGETLKNQYLMSLQHVADYVAETLNKFVIKPIAQMNFGENVRTPYLCATGIQAEDMQMIADAFNKLGNSQLVTKGPRIESYIRETLGIPMEDEPEEEEEIETSPTPAPPSQEVDDADDDGDGEDNPTDADMDAPTGDAGDGTQAKDKPGVKAAETVPFAPNGEVPNMQVAFWRPLRPLEEFVSLRGIAGKLDDAREAVVRDTKAARERMIQELLPQMNAAFQEASPKLVAEIDYSDELAEELEAAVFETLQDVYFFGYQSITTELAKQSKSVKNAFPNVTGEAAKAQKAVEAMELAALQVREKSLDRVVDFARAAALTSIRTGRYDVVDITQDMAKFSENEIRKEGAKVVNDANSLGRDAAMRENKKDIQYAEYSAILDAGTCDNCYAVDQANKKYEVGSPEFEQVTPPLYNCESAPAGNLCRCIWVVQGAID